MYTPFDLVVRFRYTRPTHMPNPAPSSSPHLPPKQARVDVRVSPDDLRVWREAAVFEKSTLSDWIRRACDDRATEVTKKDVKKR